MAMKYILEHGDELFIQDSITMQEGTLKDPNYNFQKDDFGIFGSKRDTSIWSIKPKTYSTSLANYTPYLRTLEGEEVNIYGLYSEYLILFGYQMSGRSKWECIHIREKIKEVEKLNKEFGPRIQLVLVNRDRLEVNP